MNKTQLTIIITLAILGMIVLFLGLLAKLEHWEVSANYMIFGGMFLQFLAAGVAIFIGLSKRGRRKN